jgi:hypothetical protein
MALHMVDNKPATAWVVERRPGTCREDQECAGAAKTTARAACGLRTSPSSDNPLRWAWHCPPPPPPPSTA